MRTLTLVLVALALTPPQDRRVDAALARLAAAAPARETRILAKLRPGATLPAGVTITSRSGDVLALRGSAAQLASLDLERCELARTCRVRNDITAASSIGCRGLTAGETDSYAFAGVAGQTVRVRVHPEGSLDPNVTVTDGASVTSDDDSGPGSAADLTVTWSSTGSKTIDVAPVSGTGAYLLFITASTPITTGALTGGDTAISTVHYAGTRAREARGIEGVDGSGVLIGFVDTGIDTAHADFRAANGGTRLVGLWDQTLTVETGESAPSAGYGVFYDETDVNAGKSRSRDTEGHGSQVAAIAAGDDPVFTGAAPGARLFMVKTDFSTTGIIDGISLILERAKKLDFDAVVINLSLGTHDGPHDGTSLLDAAISAATSRAHHVICAAGNEGDPADAILHANAAVTSAVTWTFTPTVALSEPHAIDIWADGADAYTVSVTDNLGTTVTATSGTSAAATPGFTVLSLTVDNKIDSPSNGATHMRVEILPTATILPWSITLTRTTSAGSGVVDGWIATESGTFLTGDIVLNTDGSVPGTVVEPATSTGAIAVAAVRGRFMWETASATSVLTEGTGIGVSGNAAFFSSRGPTRDGRMKPEIAAPGSVVAGARSADAAPATGDIDIDGVHVYGQGTSFASPAVAGVVALLLQKHRLLTNDELKARIASTALADGFVSTGNTWGAGKIDATALLASVYLQVDITADAGQCFQGVPVRRGDLLALACLAAALVVVLIRRRS